MKRLISGGHFYEGARWHDGAWYVSDLYAHQVLRITQDGRSEVVAELNTEPSGLGWLPDGSLLIVSMSDRRLLRKLPDGSLCEHADLSAHASGWINDMVVDRQGYAFVSSFGFDLWAGAAPRPAVLCRVSPDGTVTVAAEDLLFPNGVTIALDDKTLIVAETFGNRMTAFTIAGDGALRDRRIWAEFGPCPSWATPSDLAQEDFAPDGVSMDAQGCVWVADALHNRVCRVAEGGAILEEHRTPENWGIYSCALGGADGRTLLICSAPDFDHIRRHANNEAVLFTHQVEVPAASAVPEP